MAKAKRNEFEFTNSRKVYRMRDSETNYERRMSERKRTVNRRRERALKVWSQER